HRKKVHGCCTEKLSTFHTKAMVKKNFIFSVLTKNQCALNRVLNSYKNSIPNKTISDHLPLLVNLQEVENGV
ncbi:MAG: hypothetical protein MR383_08165, partial [Lachnospiraceae bacterium]|nr:hypothetical protein [Lachnospiraceae bacterium]